MRVTEWKRMLPIQILMFVFKKENQIFWILCEAWVSGSLSASKITCGHLGFKSTKGSYVEILLNGITGTWLPRNGLYPAQVDTYSELGMLRCEHHVLTTFWELTHVSLVSWEPTDMDAWERTGFWSQMVKVRKRPSILTRAVSHHQHRLFSRIPGLTLGWPHYVHSKLTPWNGPAASCLHFSCWSALPDSNALGGSSLLGLLALLDGAGGLCGSLLPSFSTWWHRFWPQSSQRLTKSEHSGTSWPLPDVAKSGVTGK